MSEEKHEIKIDQRENVFVSGVNELISFDEENIIVDTQMDVLIIRGHGLHVTKLNLDNGELEIEGEIYEVRYEQQGVGQKNRASFLKKIFK